MFHFNGGNCEGRVGVTDGSEKIVDVQVAGLWCSGEKSYDCVCAGERIVESVVGSGLGDAEGCCEVREFPAARFRADGSWQTSARVENREVWQNQPGSFALLPEDTGVEADAVGDEDDSLLIRTTRSTFEEMQSVNWGVTFTEGCGFTGYWSDPSCTAPTE